MKTQITAIAFSLLAAGCLGAADPNLIPLPAKVESVAGSFKITAHTRLIADGAFANEAAYLQQQWRSATGQALQPGAEGSGNVIRLVKAAPGMEGAEAYSLAVAPGEITLKANEVTGIFWGIQTLLQLMPPSGASELSCVKIEDAPRFEWRGLMLDCSRTFQSIDYLKKTIDRMASYKLNVLHLHLTDDQGWRLQIKKYPELTEKGARFPEKYNEPPEHQGFYTQEQMRDLVAYAAARHITVVPEIEMPGHSLAALSVMPRLSCTGGPFEIFPFYQGPGITPDIFCAGKEETFTFFENVLSEVMDIFPSKFIHIGGDESPRIRWKSCPLCQKRIQEKGLKNEAELQNWFTRRAEEMLAARGRRLIGWDEILEGKLSPTAAVMSWRGAKGGIAAAKEGRDVVMSPQGSYYLSDSYSRISADRAYAFNPLADLPPDAARRVMGLQACYWSHIDREPERVDAKLYPRLLAVAERAWSPASCTDWEGFRRRLLAQVPRMEQSEMHPWVWDLASLAGEWGPKDVPKNGIATLEFDVTGLMTAAGRYQVMPVCHGERGRGDQRIVTIRSVELMCGDRLAAKDNRQGKVDDRDLATVPWTLEVGEVPPSQVWRLRVDVDFGTVGKKSWGRVLFKSPGEQSR